MRQFLERAKEHPFVAHVIRAVEHYLTRLGNQSAAAIAYFSVVSLVPILMCAFAVTGIVLTVARPDLLEAVQQQITAELQGSDLGEQIGKLIDNALHNWQAVGIVGIGAGLWAGSRWAKNLKRAVRAQLRQDYDAGDTTHMFVLEILINLVIAFALFVGLAVTISVSSTVTGASAFIADLFGLQGGWSRLLVSLSGLGVSLITGFALFAFLLWALPDERIPRRLLLEGAVIGSIGLALLQYVGSILVAVFSRNVAASFFGPVIVLMLFLNVFANLIILVAGWVATAEAPEPVREVIELPSRPAVEQVDPRMRRGFRIGTVVGAGVLLASAGILHAVAGAADRVRAAVRRTRS